MTNIEELRKKVPALASQFPRVFDTIAMQWEKPNLDAVFSELVIDSRGGRKGFPPDVLIEIQRLRDMHDTLFPKTAPAYNTYPWDEVSTLD